MDGEAGPPSYASISELLSHSLSSNSNGSFRSSSVASNSSSQSYDISERLFECECEEIPDFQYMSRSLRWVSRSTTLSGDSSSCNLPVSMEISGSTQNPNDLGQIPNRFTPKMSQLAKLPKMPNLPQMPKIGKWKRKSTSKKKKNKAILVFYSNGGNSTVNRPRFNPQDLMNSGIEVLGKETSHRSTYRVTLENGHIFMAKSLRNEDVSCCQIEFSNQMHFINRIRHSNIVFQTGFCYSQQEKLLFSDYFPNGTLYKFLHGTFQGKLRKSTPDWSTRLSIVLGVAQALAHIHEEGTHHGNVKSSNILLGENNNPYISDLGMALLMTPAAAARWLGGYSAPELPDTQSLSTEADVYAFGVLMLEIIMIKEPPSTTGIGQDMIAELLHWVLHWKEEVFLEYKSNEEVMKMAQVAVECVSEQPDLRPTMQEVVKMIVHAMVEQQQNSKSESK